MNEISNTHPVCQFFADVRDVVVGTFKNIFFPMSYFENLNRNPEKLKSISAVQLNRFGRRAFNTLNPELYTQRQVQHLNDSKLDDMNSVGRLRLVLDKLTVIQTVAFIRMQDDLQPEFLDKVMPERILLLLSNEEIQPRIRITEKISGLFRNLAQQNQASWEGLFLRMRIAFSNSQKGPAEIAAVRDLLSTSSVPSLLFIQNLAPKEDILFLLSNGQHGLPLFQNISLKFYLDTLNSAVYSNSPQLDRARVHTNLNTAAQASETFKLNVRSQPMAERLQFLNDPRIATAAKVNFLRALEGIFSPEELQFYALFVPDPGFQREKFKNLTVNSFLTLLSTASDNIQDVQTHYNIKSTLQLHARRSETFNQAVGKQTLKDRLDLFNDPRTSTLAKLSFLELLGTDYKISREDYLLFASLIPSPKLHKTLFGKEQQVQTLLAHIELLIKAHIAPHRLIPVGSYLTQVESMTNASHAYLKSLAERLVNDLFIKVKALTDSVEFIEKTMGQKNIQAVKSKRKGRCGFKSLILGGRHEPMRRYVATPRRY